MERLAERKISYPSCDKNGNLERVDYIEIKDKKLAEEKLYQLENIEELCEKIINQTIYEKNERGEIYEENYKECQSLYNFKEKRIEILYCIELVNWFELDSYGKTWALTKEELENE